MGEVSLVVVIGTFVVLLTSVTVPECRVEASVMLESSPLTFIT